MSTDPLAKPRILIVEDHAALRERIVALLEARHANVVGAVADGAAACAVAAELQPDLVLLDLSLPDQSGLDVLPALLRVAPAAKVIFLTGHEDPELSRVCIADGGRGFIGKSLLARDVDAALREVMAGRIFCSALGSP